MTFFMMYMYSGAECVCGVTLSVYPRRASYKISLTMVGIEPTTFAGPMLCQTELREVNTNIYLYLYV